MKILAFSASNSSQSINRALIDLTLARLQQKVDAELDISVINIHDYEMPIYSFDREQADGTPELAQELFGKIGESDLVLISFAEHNGNVTAAWKNIFDWMSRIDAKVWQNRKLAFMAASPGAGGGASVLKLQTGSVRYFSGELIGSMGVGRWPDAYDPQTQTLQHQEDIEALDDLLDEICKLVAAGNNEVAEA